MKTVTESELTAEIVKVEEDISVTRRKLAEIRKSFDHTESDLISLKLRKEKLNEQLHKIRAADINQPPTLRELDIAGFRERMPHLNTSVSKFETVSDSKKDK